MAARFVIRGRRPIGGRLRAPGNKNAALPMLAAALLTDQPVELQDVPIIEDVHAMLAMLAHLGVAVSLDRERRRVRLQARDVQTTALPRDLCRRVRASILFAGPLCARASGIELFPPGGDVIGRRRLDTHFSGLAKLGVTIDGYEPFSFRAPHLTGARILLDEASVTATENLVMAAVLANGRTTLRNAACEPHVEDLCRMLVAMGARIEGIGTNRLRIDGVERLGGVTYRVGPDYIAAGSYLAAAAATGGELIIDNVSADDFEILERPFQRLGVQWRIHGDTLFLPGSQTLEIADDLGHAIPKIEDGIWPGFPSDLLSVMIVLATQARGTLLVFEKMFESRLYFVDHLIGMGARIVQCDPHRLIVSGPTPLHGTRVSSPDIRAGMALILAALCAQGVTTVQNAQHIDRGYEAADDVLRQLNADVVREAR